MRKLNFYLGLFVVTAAVLMFQVIETRVLSVISWYYLSFFVISMAMFGLTAGAVWVYLQGERFTESSLSGDLTYFTGAFAVTTALSLLAQLNLPVQIIDWADPVRAILNCLIWAALLGCIALPFFYSGIVVSLALTRSPFPIGRVYGVDLAGAAVGCLGVLLVLNLTDGPSAVLWVSVVAALGGWLFSAARIGSEDRVPGPLAFVFSRPAVVIPLLAVLAAYASLSDGIRPLFVKGRSTLATPAPVFEEWNSFSRVALFDFPEQKPRMWGPAPNFRPGDWPTEQRILTIDGDAGTVSYRVQGDVERAGFLKYDVTNLAYYLPGHESAAVIGVGSGRDMLGARVFGVPEITGVEINPIIMRALIEEPGLADYAGVGSLDGMTFEVDEARSWFARSQERFDVVQMSLIDTWAATGAGAYTLSENGLYTVEAWRIFLEHLTAEGVFTVSRWYGPGDINETGRMISLAMAAAREVGAAEPKQHIFVATSGRIATLILSRSPLPQSHIQTLEKVAGELGYDVLISPFGAPSSPVLQEILASDSRAELETFTANLSLDLTPPTDERPFFFNQLPFRNLGKFFGETLPNLSQGVASGNLRATNTLALLIVLSGLLVLFTIVVPLRPAIRDVGKRLAYGGTAYFLLIGAGFMCAEIALLQRMSVFLGHPIYSLSITLFSMILSTGIGSFLSDRFPLEGRSRFAFWSVLTAAYILSLTLWLPSALLTFDSEGLVARALVSIAAIAPAGFLMGFGFPTGMRLISAVDSKPTPWFWGINGAAGVLASCFAVLCSIAFGITATLVLASVCYLLLIPAGLAIGFREPRAVGGLSAATSTA